MSRVPIYKFEAHFHFLFFLYILFLQPQLIGWEFDWLGLKKVIRLVDREK